MNQYQTSLYTPIGFYKLSSNDHALISNEYLGNTLQEDFKSKANEILRFASEQIQEFFFGVRKEFTIPFEVSGSELMQKVYKILAQVPYGSTIKYGELAKKAGIVHGGRFVGNTMARNLIPILIPCHRVIYADGSIGSYSAGGEKIKKWLLDWESSHIRKEMQ